MNTFLQRLLAGTSAAATALLVACGGGGDAGGSASSQSVYQGTIGGFGSVIVNGVRFDDSAARITVDDEAVTVGALKLGMRTEVTGSVAADGSTGTATSCVVDTALRGPIASIDVATNSFKIRGISVVVDDKTVYEGAGNLAALKVGDWVEVHGSVDFTNRTVQATRVEVKPPEEVGRVVLFGKATGVTATTFTLGDLTVNYSSARLIGFDNNTITEGAVVRVRSNVAPVGNVLTATVVKAVKAPRLTDGTPAAVEGRIQQYVSVSNFLVSGTAVDATNAEFTFGSAADLSEGKRVIVFGTLADGKIIAKKIRIFRPDLDGEVRLIGMVSDFVSVSSFKVRGVAVDASAATFEGGDAPQLTDGRLVEIKGQSAGSVVKATKVEFEETRNGSNAVLTGVVSGFVSTADFKVAGKAVKVAADVRYVNGTAASVVDGVTLWLTGATDASGVFVAKVVIVSPSRIIGPTQAAGTVADVAADGSFKLNGTLVTTSTGTRFFGGTAANLVAGTWVIVTGKVTANVLAAETITFPPKRNEDCGAFKIEGIVYDYVSVANFKLFGLTVDASAASFEGGAATDLANGKVVQACGNELPVAGVLKALKVEFK
jgi:hypothetical protein